MASDTGKNEILLWAPEADSESIEQFSLYEDSEIRLRGAIAGEEADNKTYNKVLQQLTKVAKAFTLVISNKKKDISDDITPEQIANFFTEVLLTIIEEHKEDTSNFVSKDTEIKGISPVITTGTLGSGITIKINENWFEKVSTLERIKHHVFRNSGSITFGKDCVVKAIIIGAGGGGGRGATDSYGEGGEKGGNSSFYGVTALGGSGGAGGSYRDGGGGGSAGEVIIQSFYCVAGMEYTILVGKGGKGGQSLYLKRENACNGEGDFGGIAAITDNTGGGGAGGAGAGNGNSFLLKNMDDNTASIQGGFGGTGGTNGSIYGNGGGGGGGSGDRALNHGMGGRAAHNAQAGKDALSYVISGNGGDGGDGAIILEYIETIPITTTFGS